MATTTLTIQLPDSMVSAIEARATKHSTTMNEALASLIEDALDMKGRDGLETRVAAMQAVIGEQERIIAQHGKTTPRPEQLVVDVSLMESAKIAKAARQAGLTMSAYMRRRILRNDMRRDILTGRVPVPAGMLSRRFKSNKRAPPGGRPPALPPTKSAA